MLNIRIGFIKRISILGTKVRLFQKDCPSWHENLLSFNFLSLSFIHYSKYFRIFALNKTK